MSGDDDDLRFGDVQNGEGNSAIANADVGDLAPFLVAAILCAYIVAAQPLSGSLSGINLNWVAAALILVGGASASFS
jgi:hypothetical protein